MTSAESMPEMPSANPATPVTRRSLRESRRAASGPRGAHLARWTSRTLLLTVLAGATIGVPLASAGSAGTGSAVDMAAAAAPVGPSALKVLSSASVDRPPVPASVLAPIRGARLVSRAVERSPLPGCDSEARPAGANGLIPSVDLCPLWDLEHMLRGDAAVALSELNRTFRARFGRDLCVTDSYRSLEAQRHVARTKPGLAAVPGRSNHGWGLAIDLCSSETGDPTVMGWLGANGPAYGWDNPHWARRGGSGPYEPWHWEYVPGTTEQGTSY